MNEDVRSITSKNLPDAIRLLNESSRDTSLQYNVDFFDFLGLKRFWNFSLSHSLIRYIDNQAAAIAINCADPETRHAYTFYWGTLPQFRNAKLSISLFDTFCQKLRDDGYTMLYADAIPDRPAQRYRFIQMFPLDTFLDMKGDGSHLSGHNPSFTVRKIDVALLSQIPFPSGDVFHWSQRPSFLANIDYFVEILGAFAGDCLKAYAVVPAHPREMILFDLRSSEECFPAGNDLLHYLAQHYPSPIRARPILSGSFAHRLLSDAGFSVTRSYSSLVRDLRITRSRRQAS